MDLIIPKEIQDIFSSLTLNEAIDKVENKYKDWDITKTTEKYSKVAKIETGEYFPIDYYDKIIDNTEYGYKEDGSLLFCLVKNNIKEDKRKKYKDAMRSNCRALTKNRGASAGPVDLKQFPKKAVSFCDRNGKEFPNDKKRYSVHFKDEEGVMIKRCQSNSARSGVAGFFDPVAGFPCRKVGWSNKNPLKHKVLEELAIEIEEGHKKYCPESYEFHLEQSGRVNKEYLFKDSIYSTMTLNYDFRTATHRDSGDLQGGLSTLTILEEIENNYTGFYLGLPEYKICFNVKDGDTLYFDAHELHANTEYEVLSDNLPINKLTEKPYAGRMSIVCYLRNRLHTCS